MPFGHLLRGAIWSVLGKALQFLLGLVALTLLARTLGPEVFGVYAMGWVLLGLLEIVVISAPIDALVQRREATPGHFNVTFWVAGGLSVVAVLSIWAGAGPLSQAVGGGALLASVLPLRALCLPIRVAGIGPTASLMRASRFGDVAAVDTLGSIAASAVGVALALGGAGIWSLVAMELARAVVTTVLLLWRAAWRPGLAMRLADLRDLTAFNVSTWGAWGLGYLDGQLPRLVVNHVLGAEAVGYLTIAQRLFETISDVLVVPVYNVIQAGAARAQERLDEVRRLVLATMEIGALLATPLFIGIAVLAPAVMEPAFGDSWASAIPVVQLMVLSGLRLPTSVTQGAAIRGLGKPHWDLVSALLLLLINATLLWLAAPHGLLAVAAAMLVGFWLIWPLDAYFLDRLIGLSMGRQLVAFLRTLVAGIGMAAIVAGLGQGPLADWPSAGRLAVQVLVGALVYALLLHLSMPVTAGRARRFLFAAVRLDRHGMRDALRPA